MLLLARTGMRVGELCNLAADPVVEIGDHHSLHVPVGKLRNDRYVPLHPTLVDLIADWQTTNAVHIARTGRLLTDDVSAVDRHRVARMVRRIAKNAGIGWVHPHQLRHTLATQAINRGMRLEAVAALLGHKNLEMTMVYARIADATVAEEYFDVATQVDQLYATATHRNENHGLRPRHRHPDRAHPSRSARALRLAQPPRRRRHNPRRSARTDRAEQLSAALERTLVEPFQSDYDELVQRARTHLTTDPSPIVITGIMPVLSRVARRSVSSISNGSGDSSGACPLADALVSVDGPLGRLFNPDCVDAVGEDEGGADDAEGAGDLVEEQVSEVGGAGQSGVAEGNRDTEVADSNGRRASLSPSPDFTVLMVL